MLCQNQTGAVRRVFSRAGHREDLRALRDGDRERRSARDSGLFGAEPSGGETGRLARARDRRSLCSLRCCLRSDRRVQSRSNSCLQRTQKRELRALPTDGIDPSCNQLNGNFGYVGMKRQ